MKASTSILESPEPAVNHAGTGFESRRDKADTSAGHALDLLDELDGVVAELVEAARPLGNGVQSPLLIQSVSLGEGLLRRRCNAARQHC